MDSMRQLGFLLEIQTDGIDAVALAAFVGRAIFKDMAEVGAAVFAGNFCTDHAVVGVGF